MIEWKWTHGDKYSKTPRKYKMNENENMNNSVETESSAVIQSLLTENEIDNIWNFSINQGKMMNQMINEPNKREDSYNRMADREMMSQVNKNPFMADRNYLEDVIVQDQYLKPKNTIDEKEISSPPDLK